MVDKRSSGDKEKTFIFKFFKDGQVDFDDEWYDTDEYCLEDYVDGTFPLERLPFNRADSSSPEFTS